MVVGVGAVRGREGWKGVAPGRRHRRSRWVCMWRSELLDTAWVMFLCKSKIGIDTESEQEYCKTILDHI